MPSMGAFYLNYEEDLRAIYTPDIDDVGGEIHALGASVRQVFSDKRGDRVILYLQAEAEHNISEIMAHQAYLRYKGPMGKWNITLGRVPLPWGLLTDWSPERMLYSSPYKIKGTLKNDNGLLLNGVLGMFDYGLSITQGFGMSTPTTFWEDGLFTGRIGISPLLGGELLLGGSASYGTSYRMSHGHAEETTSIKHMSGTFDLTAYIGQIIMRLEIGAERADDLWSPQGFIALEYQLLPKLNLISASNLVSIDEKWHKTLFAGAETTIQSVTIRGGYEYEHHMDKEERVVLQLYRQFAFSR